MTAAKKDDTQPTSAITTYEVALKADTKMVVNDVLVQEDDFQSFYWNDKNKGNMVLEPPYNPYTLQSLLTKNNILAQVVSTMEVNIDGTGFTIEPLSPDKAGNEDEKVRLENFFNEPFPEISFLSIRRQLRYDLESIGNAYLEILRNISGEIVFVRYLDGTSMRLCRLDEAIQVEKEITRGTEKVKATIWVRERRYAQKMGTKLIFFKEFGASRKLNRDTGDWVKEGVAIDANTLSSEVIHFTCEKDVKTPYGIPRWINQLPSVMGSRKAEEFNLQFFDAGGIPPAAIFVQGGALALDVTEQLKGFFSGANGNKHRVAVVEVQSTSGSLDSAGSVQVKVERFGDSRANDAMFQVYDKNCEEHIRIGFRLPPLFVGRAQDYNFATAVTAYMVAEAQVFAPERLEFDEVINTKIVRALGIQDWKYTSKPLTLKNVEIQLQAIEMLKDKVESEEMVTTVNDISGLNLKYSKEAEDKSQVMQNAQVDALRAKTVADSEAATATAPVGKPVLSVVKSEGEVIVDLVNRWAVAVGIEKGVMTDDERAFVLESVNALKGESKAMFDSILATKAFVFPNREGLSEIAGCCAHAVS
jgi:PBSX family phage portal protein